MRFLALACDYDGTLAHDGRVDDVTLGALHHARDAGHTLLLVTGRELDDLARIFPHLDLFARVVAENGALLYRPDTREHKVLADRPPDAFIARLAERGVGPLSVGHAIVATWTPHESVVLDTIHEQGLELQVIFNKGAVMVLPSGVNKASGLKVALEELGLSAHNVVGVGDAENDHAFLEACGCSVAVANALPALRERVDLVTEADHGAGVVELVARLLADDLAGVCAQGVKHTVTLGSTEGGDEVRLAAYGSNVLIAGASKGGKTTFAISLIERLTEAGYQLCILDPEGDYSALAGVALLGEAARAPTVNEVLDALRSPAQSVVVNLLGVPLPDRPRFFAELMPRLQALRASRGRPHWIALDEAHHFQPGSKAALDALPLRLAGTLLVTVEPDHLSTALLARVEVLIVLGDEPGRTIRAFCAALGETPPRLDATTLGWGEALVWLRAAGEAPVRLRYPEPTSERHRHRRKYATGELMPHRRFVFRGPGGRLNLEAPNLTVFLQLAEGVDDETWTYHLKRGDYSRWFRIAIDDEDLAGASEAIEQAGLSPADSRARIRSEVEARYTAPI